MAIDAETDRLNALIANLLDMSRIEAGLAPGAARDGRPGRDDRRIASTGSARQRRDLDVDVRIAPEAGAGRAPTRCSWTGS